MHSYNYYPIYEPVYRLSKVLQSDSSSSSKSIQNSLPLLTWYVHCYPLTPLLPITPLPLSLTSPLSLPPSLPPSPYILDIPYLYVALLIIYQSYGCIMSLNSPQVSLLLFGIVPFLGDFNRSSVTSKVRSFNRICNSSIRF